MIGFNGGLIGAARETSFNQSVPGVWTPLEQLQAKRALLWPASAGEDPYFANVSLLLRGNGTNGSTTIADESFSPKTMIAVSAFISTVQYQYGGASIDFDGSTQSKYVYSTNTSIADFGTADFTLEAWVRISSRRGGTANQYVMDTSGSNRIALLTGYSGGFEKAFFLFAGTSVISSATVISYGVWQHWAATRSGTTLRLFIDGIQCASGTSTANISSPGTFYIGNFKSPSASFTTNGYIDDLRITKGVARYTSNFTPPGAL